MILQSGTLRKSYLYADEYFNLLTYKYITNIVNVIMNNNNSNNGTKYI